MTTVEYKVGKINSARFVKLYKNPSQGSRILIDYSFVNPEIELELS